MIRVAGILIIALGVFTLRGQFAPDRLVTQSQSWLSTQGLITSFSTSCYGGGFHTVRVCSVRLNYRYRIAGENFDNGRITFNDDNLDTIDDVRQYRARYAVGQSVPVFYDPRNPTDAVLERTASWGLWDLFAGAAAVLVGALMLLPRSWIYRLGGAPIDVAES